MKIKLSTEQLNMAREAYLENKSLRKTSDLLGISRNALTRIFKENNIAIGMSCTNMKPNFIEYYFDKIDSDQKAYWLGFLSADGYLDHNSSSIRVELAEKDLCHLKAFCNTISYPVEKISKREERNTHWVSISSKKMFDTLISLDIKSDKLLFSKLPQELHSSFLRGFYDGDGSIYHQGKSSLGTGLIATKAQIETISKVLPLTDIKIRPVAKTKPEGMWRLETYNLSASLQLCEYLYQNSTVKLERKYNKYVSRSTDTFMKKLQRL